MAGYPVRCHPDFRAVLQGICAIDAELRGCHFIAFRARLMLPVHAFAAFGRSFITGKRSRALFRFGTPVPVLAHGRIAHGQILVFDVDRLVHAIFGITVATLPAFAVRIA